MNIDDDHNKLKSNSWTVFGLEAIALQPQSDEAHT